MIAILYMIFTIEYLEVVMLAVRAPSSPPAVDREWEVARVEDSMWALLSPVTLSYMKKAFVGNEKDKGEEQRKTIDSESWKKEWGGGGGLVSRPQSPSPQKKTLGEER